MKRVINVIEIKNVTKKYGDFTAIENINLTVDDCSVLGLAGFNGCGKTTLLNVCAGIFKADTGAAYLDGKDAFDNDTERKNLFYVSDTMWFPAGASISSAARFYAGYFNTFDFKTLDALCDLFGLDPKKPIRSFSKGMTRQAGLAIAFSSKPKYLLIDETFDGLDPHKKEVVRKLLLEYINECEASVIVSSHDLAEISGVCDHIAIMNGTKIVLNTSIDDISENFRKVVIRFSEAINEETFKDINCRHLRISDKTATMTICGDVDNQLVKLSSLNPASIDTSLLTLEEVFSAETEAQSDNEKIKRIFK